MEAAGAGLVQEPQTLLHVVVDGAQGGHDGRGPEPVGDGGEVRQMSLHEVRINIIIIIFRIFVIIIIIISIILSLSSNTLLLHIDCCADFYFSS